MNLRKATEAQLVIHWADLLIIYSNYKGEIDTFSFFPMDGVFEDSTPDNIKKWQNDEARKIRKFVVDNLGNVNGNLDIITAELTKYREAVKLHLLTEGYINEPSPILSGWQLNEIGKEVKRIGGHNKYQARKRREIRAAKSDQNAKIFWLPRKVIESFITVSIGIVIGYAFRYFTEPKQPKSGIPVVQKSSESLTKGKDTANRIVHIDTTVKERKRKDSFKN